MPHLHVFTDASVNTQIKVGYGAYLVVFDQSASADALKNTVITKRFEQTSSSKLELQTLLWSLEQTMLLAGTKDLTLTLYTDSQNIINLPARQTRLEQNNYISSNNRQLNNYELYQAFYQLTAKIPCTFVKMLGHKASSKKDDTDRLFSLVDRASRRALRNEF